MPMRALAFLVFAGGLMLIGFAFMSNVRFVATGQSGWDENGHYVLAVDEVSNRRLRRMLQSYVVTGAALSDGMFYDMSDDLEPMLPAAPAGWVRTDWTIALGEALTSTTYRRTMVSISTTNSILADFEESAQDGFGAAAVYDTGNGLIALRIMGDTQARRDAGHGKLSHSPATGNIAFVHDDVPVFRAPKFSNVTRTGKAEPVDYDRFTMDIGGVFELEVISSADEAATFRLLQTVGVAAIEASIPTPLASQ
jgi:hypothetical protein